MILGLLSKTSCILLIFELSDPRDVDLDIIMIFFHQRFLIFVDSWSNWCSLEMQTRVPP
jgi:hypothetical protein